LIDRRRWPRSPRGRRRCPDASRFQNDVAVVLDGLAPDLGEDGVDVEELERRLAAAASASLKPS
jgi:hypothetical protein